MSDTIPEGFIPLPSGLGFTDAIAPLYRRVNGDKVSFGLHVTAVHANTMGICHGGVLMTMADVTAASGVNAARGETMGSPTINLSVDFIAAGRMGDWLQGDIDHVVVKRRFGFCAGTIANEAGLVARFNGTFYLPDHEGMWKVEKPADGAFGAD